MKTTFFILNVTFSHGQFSRVAKVTEAAKLLIYSYFKDVICLLYIIFLEDSNNLNMLYDSKISYVYKHYKDTTNKLYVL